jgi:uncharacterized protein YidB (DUF937 family)
MGLLDQLLGDVLNQMGNAQAPQQAPQQGRMPAGMGMGAGGMGMGGAGGMAAAGGGSALLAMAMQFVSNYPGGLPALLAQFSRAGYGQQANSWVGSGQNEAIPADALSQIFGQGQMQQMGQQLGVSPNVAAGGLAALLPELVNQLTPEGRMDPRVEKAQGDDLASLMEGLRRNFG